MFTVHVFHRNDRKINQIQHENEKGKQVNLPQPDMSDVTGKSTKL